MEITHVGHDKYLAAPSLATYIMDAGANMVVGTTMTEVLVGFMLDRLAGPN